MYRIKHRGDKQNEKSNVNQRAKINEDPLFEEKLAKSFTELIK